jgi:hypothetical protein
MYVYNITYICSVGSVVEHSLSKRKVVSSNLIQSFIHIIKIYAYFYYKFSITLLYI